MDLTYIFDYIDKNKSKKEDDISILNYPPALLPETTEKPDQFEPWMKSIFIKWNNEVMRMGTINGTMYDAIFYCIDPLFKLLTSQEQKKYVTNVCTLCYKELNKIDKKINMFQDFGYKKLGWKKSTLTYLLKKEQASIEVIRWFVDYFEINIILVDADDQDLQLHYSDGKLCPYKETIIIVRTKTGFDPLINNDKYSWNYNDSFLKQFIDKYKTKFICPSYSQTGKDPITRSLELLLLKETKEINQEELQDVFNKDMDLSQLQKYAKKYGIPIKMGKKFRSKQMLKDHLKKIYDSNTSSS